MLRAERSRGRPFFGILVKLLFAFTVPLVVLFAVFASVAHEVERRDLEAELGTRLAAVASAAAAQIRGEYLVNLQREEDRNTDEYRRYRPRLEQLAGDTGAARMYVIDRQFVTKVVSDEIVPPGGEYVWARLDRSQLERVFAGESVSSTPFEGKDGVQYMAGYAPVHNTDAGSPIVLALGVEAAPAYFERLAELRRSLFIWGAGLTAFMLGVTLLVAALLTRPLRRLAAAAERIGHGDLEAPIDVGGRDEIGVLAATMEEMRADLRARDQRLHMMLSGIAHEVRNPLGGMQLYTGILRDELAGDDEKRAHVDRIDKELAYLGAVVSDFLDYARRPPLQPADVDLAAVAGEVADLLRGDAERAAVTLETELAPAPCRGDERQLHRAAINLVKNAIQAAEKAERGRVRVETGLDAGTAFLRVANDGAPIPADQRERIFEPFFSTREKGTGLGLAFVRDIAADHGGQVTVRDGGELPTVFELTVPAA